MADLPPWVYDVVMALDKWNAEHAPLFVEVLRTEKGMYDSAPDCGCKALDLVPKDVLENARAMRAYLEAKDRDKEPGEGPTWKTACPRCGGPVDQEPMDVRTSWDPFAPPEPGRWACQSRACNEAMAAQARMEAS